MNMFLSAGTKGFKPNIAHKALNRSTRAQGFKVITSYLLRSAQFIQTNQATSVQYFPTFIKAVIS